MLFDAVVRIQLPGNNEQDAVARLKNNIPNWKFDVVSMEAAPVQPPKLTGTGKIELPLMGVANGR